MQTAQAPAALSEAQSFLTGANADYIAHLYARYCVNPGAVDGSWQSFFSALNDNEIALLGELNGASWTPAQNRKARNFDHMSAGAGVGGETSRALDAQIRGAVPGPSPASDAAIRRAATDSIRALQLVRAYRARGHLIADLDPLGLRKPEYHPELDPAHYGFTSGDYDRPIFMNGMLGMESGTLREILDALRQIYCSTIGVEFLHLSDPQEKSWVQERIEGARNQTDFSVNGKRAILQRLMAAEIFEQFLHRKYVGTKRFGLDGGEAVVPAIEQIMKRGGQMGLKEIAIGMSHRGRLNVLTNVLGKPFTAIFSEFQGGTSQPEDVQGSGDVKYHLGTSSDRDFDGNTIHLSLTANPSHLEAVNPVVIGKVRAKQVQRDDKDNRQVLALLLHGDAAFAGQGLVAETLMISELPGYRIGGTIHIVINNQIGFTTTPKYGRSGPYSTDVAKMLAAPIFHVNGDDPEAVVHVARIATEFRMQFRKDVVIDIFCYRRFGHNEGDEPSFTQPLMYRKIAAQESTRAQYARKLVAERVLTQGEVDAMAMEFNAYLEKAYEATTGYKPGSADYLKGVWEGLGLAPDPDNRRGDTAVDASRARRVGLALTEIPEGFTINPKLRRVVEARRNMIETGEGFDWAAAEQLAFGVLIDEGYPVRLSGQDVGRGTFSQRHAIWYDQETEEKHIPVQHIRPDQPRAEIHDSPLSEAAVLGFEYGYSLADPRTLVMWEAQFGDFANGAQVIIDQFIASGETKWLRMSGLVLLLPHGFEGQGPEHSSARLERFLQLSAEDNWQVCNCTTPANYFHALRRQIHREFRKPLIMMTPKSLLRHKLCVSPLSDMIQGSSFHRILDDNDAASLLPPKDLRRIVLCSGKVYYDLLETRRDKDLKDVMILRIEQIYPFPKRPLVEMLAASPKADIVWCQEEPQNQGAWFFVEPLIEAALKDAGHQAGRAQYVGRVTAAAPATGSLKRHTQEQARLVSEALGG
ncbi:MAG: 2-oxoglutarate dehydrogenase E1 component [Rhodospirillales bacterium]|nr:2-oxoglutarate dehydrogenase E1 component [Rhodospirillales bacterium]